MKKTRKGGTSCAYKNCKNNTRTAGLSFFRFPKDAMRSAMWIKACGRDDLKSKNCEELYKNYKVCQVHFDDKNFLNDLKNRLQNHACPRNVNNSQVQENMSSTNFATFETDNSTGLSQGTNDILLNLAAHSNSNSISNATISFSPNNTSDNWSNVESSFFISNTSPSNSISNHGVTTENCPKEVQKNVSFNCSTPTVSKELASSNLETCTKSSRSISTQTELYFSNKSPRKNFLRKKIDALRKKVERLEKKLHARNVKCKPDSINVLTKEQIHLVIDGIIPNKEAAEFVKAQLSNSNKKPNGKRYSKEFKEFCLNLYFSGPKAYRNIQKRFQLLSVRSLQKLTRKMVFHSGINKSMESQQIFTH